MVRTCAGSGIWSCAELSCGSVSKGLKGSWRAALWKHQARPWVKVQPQWQLKARGWRSCKEVGTWHHKEKPTLLVQPRCSKRPQHLGEASTIAWTPRTAAVERKQQGLRGQAVCGAEGGVRTETTALWRNAEGPDGTPDTEHLVIHTEFASALFKIVTALWFFPLEERKCST